MPDTTYSVKVNEETQERLKSLVEESGLNNKDFFINLLSNYEIQKAKEVTPILTADIEELETLTRRINSIFINASDRINTIQRESVEERERQAESNQSTIQLLQQRIKSLELEHAEDEERIQSFIQDKETAESKTDELLQQIKHLETGANDKTALIEEYKEKNDTLNSIVSEYKTAADENKNLTDTINSMKQSGEQQQHKINELTQQLQQQTDAFKTEQENMKKSFLIDKDMALLELKKEHQKELQKQQTEYSRKINEYEADVRSLLEQIQGIKTTPANKKATTGAKQTKSIATKTDE